MEPIRTSRLLVMVLVTGCSQAFTTSGDDPADASGDLGTVMDPGTGSGGAGVRPDASSTGTGGADVSTGGGGGGGDVHVDAEAGSGGRDARIDAVVSGGGNDAHVDSGGVGGPVDSGVPETSSVRDAEVEHSGGCPANLKGRALVEIPAPQGGTYCIDATEVTNGDYAAFLAAKGEDASGQDAWCSWNTSYVPRDSWPTGKDTFPVVSVDWCDAYAYCKWAGKAMCGKIGGGSNLFADYAFAPLDAWYNACSQGGNRAYPYGANYDAAACNGLDKALDAPLAVGSQATCEASYPGLRDMSGNLAEWEDSCSGTTGDMDTCRLRGGAFINGSNDLRCGMDGSTFRNFWYHFAGIRCCAPSL